MNYLYSLYDALVSISVPSDKARAVVDAMERDVGTTLATKQDLLLLKQDLQLLASKEELLLLKQDVAVLRQEMENRFALQDQKIDTLELRLTVKLGSMLIVGFGLTIAAMRVWL
jgi:regulator of sigma D